MKIEVVIEDGAHVVKTGDPGIRGRIDPSLSCEDVEELIRSGGSIPILLKRECIGDYFGGEMRIRYTKVWS